MGAKYTTERIPPATEWPTLALCVIIYGGWFAVTAWHAALSTPLLFALGAWLVAWQGSLQHEVIHGHPTRLRWLNHAIGFAPLSLWLPYSVYRREHTAHHATDHLTDPYEDTESHYLARGGGIAQFGAQIEATLVGRMLFGPPLRAMRFWLSEARRAWRDPAGVAREWALHLVAVALIVLWLRHVGLSLTTYLLCFVWPGTALLLIRSFAEHRASDDPDARTAIVVDFGPLAWLFLFNNLHVYHHRCPSAPWYALPALYRAAPDAFVAAPRYAGYRALVTQYALRPHDRLIHPGR